MAPKRKDIDFQCDCEENTFHCAETISMPEYCNICGAKIKVKKEVIHETARALESIRK